MYAFRNQNDTPIFGFSFFFSALFIAERETQFRNGKQSSLERKNENKTEQNTVQPLLRRKECAPRQRAHDQWGSIHYSALYFDYTSTHGT